MLELRSNSFANILEIIFRFLCDKQTTLDGIPVETRATYLLTSMRNTTVGEDVRQMAAVLLRRVISNEFEDFYNKVQKNII